MAIGLVLIAKIYFEQSYDSFYPNADRIYRLTGYTSNENESKVSESVSAIVAPTMKEEVPGIEAATRLTHIGGDRNKFITSDKRRYSVGGILMADSCLFDVLPRPVLSGDPKKVLARPGYAMISRSFADKLGGIDRAEGTVIASDNKPEMTLTIGGVFEDPPENSHLRYDVLVTLEEADDGGFLAWFGRHYLTYVLLSPGVTPETLRPAIDRMQQKHIVPKPCKMPASTDWHFPETYKGSAYRRSQYPEHDRHVGDPRFRTAVHGRDELYPDCDLGDREP